MTLTVSRPQPPDTEPDALVGARSLRPWYTAMVIGGTLGAFTAGWQAVERIDWAANQAGSICEISDRLSCSTVFEHWQSSALGVPNAMIALPVFAFIASAGLAGLLGGRLSRPYLRVVFGTTLFMVAFITWYMQQTAFEIGVLCLFCAGCMVSIVIAAIGITRVAATEEILGDGPSGTWLGELVDSNADLALWGGLIALVGVMLYIGVF